LNDAELDSRQMHFVRQIVNYTVKNGMMKDLSVLQESPFTEQGSISELFDDAAVFMDLRSVIERINRNGGFLQFFFREIGFLRVLICHELFLKLGFIKSQPFSIIRRNPSNQAHIFPVHPFGGQCQAPSCRFLKNDAQHPSRDAFCKTPSIVQYC